MTPAVIGILSFLIWFDKLFVNLLDKNCENKFVALV